MINNKLRRQLEVIDWDFPASKSGETKLSHWYPGSFPSQLPATFIQAFSNPGDIIFDPYGGAGTTASEAIRLGRKAFIVDINPVGILANYPFCALLLLKSKYPEKLDLFLEYINNLVSPKNSDLLDFDGFYNDANIAELDVFFSNHMRPTPNELLKKIRKGKNVLIQDLKKWIEGETLKHLLEIYERIVCSGEGTFLQLFLESMVSANLRAICSQNKSWGHIADNVYPKQFIKKDVVVQLKKWIKTLSNNLLKIKFEEKNVVSGIHYWADLHNWNNVEKVKVKPQKGAAIIITSPPYGDAIDYIFAQKLSLYFLGYTDSDIMSLCEQEIGARRKRFKTASRQLWATQMSDAAIKQAEYVRKGVFVSILPHRNHGREVGINEMTQGLKNHGWENVFEIDRSINQKKTRQSWTSIKQETICVFTKK